MVQNAEQWAVGGVCVGGRLGVVHGQPGHPICVALRWTLHHRSGFLQHYCGGRHGSCDLIDSCAIFCLYPSFKSMFVMS